VTSNWPAKKKMGGTKKTRNIDAHREKENVSGKGAAPAGMVQGKGERSSIIVLRESRGRFLPWKKACRGTGVAFLRKERRSLQRLYHRHKMKGQKKKKNNDRGKGKRVPTEKGGGSGAKDDPQTL